MTTTAEPTGEFTWVDVYPRVSKLMRTRSWVNVGYIAREYVPLAVVLGGAAWSLSAWRAGDLSTWVFGPVGLVAVVLIGALQHRLSGLGHEASHYTLFHNKLANDLVSDLLVMFPTFATTQQFRATHLDHHRFLNDPDRDPDVRRLHNAVPGAFPLSKVRFLVRYVAGGLWPPNLVHYILGQGRNAGPFARMSVRLKNPYPLWLAVVLLVVFWAAVYGLIVSVGGGRAFLLFWLVQMLTSYAFVLQLRDIAHLGNTPDAADFSGSRWFRVHPVLNYCLFPYGQEYHPTHHVFGMLPHYRAAEAHGILMGYPPYRDRVVVCRGYF